MEHRWGRRQDFYQVVSVRAAGWRVLAQVRNISLSGAYLRCALPRAGITRLRVEFKLQRETVELLAYVVRRTADGIGIEWGEFASDTVARLLAPDPAPATDRDEPSLEEVRVA